MSYELNDSIPDFEGAGLLPENALVLVRNAATGKDRKARVGRLGVRHANGLRGANKVVEYLQPFTGMPTDASTRQSLDPKTLCPEVVCTVRNDSGVAEAAAGAPGRKVQFVVAIDPEGALTVMADAGLTTRTVKANWVAAGTVAAQLAGREYFTPFPAKGDYPAGFEVKHVLQGKLRLFQARKLLSVDVFDDAGIPAPTGLASDLNWEELSPEGTTLPAEITVSVELASMLAAGNKVRATQYRVERRDDEQGNPLPSVVVRGISPTAYDLENALEWNGVKWVSVSYDLVNDVTTPRATGGGEVTAEQFAVHGARLVTLEAKAGAVAGRFSRNGQVQYLSAFELNNFLPSEGDVVSLLNGINSATWVLKNGVTYHTNGIPLKVDLITDLGASVFAKVLGGSSYANTKRFGSFTGSATNVTLENIDMLSQGEGGTTLTVANGATVHLTGLFNAQGGIGARVTQNSRFYYSGFSLTGGGQLVWASDTAYVEFRMENSTGYYLAPVRTDGSAVVEVYANFINPTNTGFALSNAVRAAGNSIVRLKTGTYTNTLLPTLVMEDSGRIEVSSAVTVSNTSTDSVAGPAGTTLARHAGATIGTIDVRVTIVELPSNLPATGGGGPGDPNADDLIAPLYDPATGVLTVRTADGENYPVTVRGKTRLVASFPAGAASYTNVLPILRPGQVGSYVTESAGGMVSGFLFKVNGVEVPALNNLQLGDVASIVGQAQSGAPGTVVMIQV
ncbi:hypothetical protein [Hymenobacter algoricola]|uniref:Uncharacterized protein n=1 Tax=Hymenobacter algoricola TaxID=486267 RepID=A0ABP7NAR4_9BACT